MTNTNTQPPSPVLFFDTVNAFQRTACLKGAIDLDLFTAIGEGSQTVLEIAKRCEATERGVRILCDFLTSVGFLTKAGGKYDLTPDSAAFLNRKSPAYIGSAIEFLLSETIYDAFRDVAETVRKGTTILPDKGSITPEHPVWVRFARAMAPMMAMPGQLMAEIITAGSPRKMKVLDIAAGHGLYGIQVAKHNPQAEIYAVDWPKVLEVATENARALGVADRHHMIPGSAFDVDYGSGYDAVLLTNFLHHFDLLTCITLLKKIHAALADGGRVYTLDFVPNEDRITPEMPARFSMTMLASTPSGDAYTFPEFQRMFHDSGFSRAEIQQLPPTFFSLMTSYK